MDQIMNDMWGEHLASRPAEMAAAPEDRRLADLFHATAPDDPGEMAWARVLARLEQLQPRPSTQPGTGGRRWLWIGAAAAAMVVLAVWLIPTWQKERPDDQSTVRRA